MSDRSQEFAHRPRTLAEFVGQKRLKEKLVISLEAAKARKKPLDHVLLSGPPGVGKTSLSYIIAAELGVNIRVTSGPALEKPGDLAAILTNSLREGDVFFIDEIHRLNRLVEEHLYPAMEDFSLDIVIGQGPAARTVRLPVPPFTLIGATTRSGLITGPMRSRFGIMEVLDFYTPEELQIIVTEEARREEVIIAPEAALEIGRRTRGTARISKGVYRRVRDFALVQGNGQITLEVAQQALALAGIDQLGLDSQDRKLLGALIEKFGGGPVGLTTLAMAMSEDPVTVEEVLEPYLVQAGLLQRTPRGRLALPKAYTHLGLPPPQREQGPLFQEPEDAVP